MSKFSSLLLLIFSIIIFAGCSGKTEDEYFNSAKKFIDEQKYDLAFEEFSKQINDFPDGQKACEALFEIGKLYHGKVVPNINEKASLQKAVEFYYKAYEKCPKSENAPSALFMVGFLQANELGNIEEAKKSYSKFLEVFPNDELAESAKIELDNLGKSPEDFLKEKIETQN